MVNLILRYVRTVIWGGCGVFTVWGLWRFERYLELGFYDSAPKQAAAAGIQLVEIVSVYVAARAADRILALIQEDFPRKLRS